MKGIIMSPFENLGLYMSIASTALIGFALYLSIVDIRSDKPKNKR